MDTCHVRRVSVVSRGDRHGEVETCGGVRPSLPSLHRLTAILDERHFRH